MLVVRLIKYYPIILNLYILLLSALQLLGVSVSFDGMIYTFIGQSFILNILILILSKKFRFCLWHRLLIYNMSFCLLLETLYNFGIEVKNSTYIVVISTIITIFVSILIFKKKGTHEPKYKEELN